MNRASPADIRKSLVIAHEIAKAGILFVPIPVTSREEFIALGKQAESKMSAIADEIEKSEVQHDRPKSIRSPR